MKIREYTSFGASTGNAAKENLQALIETWEKKYPLALKSWTQNWTNLSTFFNYPVEIRTMIYTTNAIEALHSHFRKITKSKSLFPNDDALIKILYLAHARHREKMNPPRQKPVISHFSIIFDERLAPFL